ncbi:hypothetical protein SEPCBS57363_004312 [Sporothrix epigloea]|uniref:DEUBAD domain-containing protein n=1 Tax=Sporothrix epigloea TaxID=1892477 RepID=A0ABP0DRC0_9PEZI
MEFISHIPSSPLSSVLDVYETDRDLEHGHDCDVKSHNFASAGLRTPSKVNNVLASPKRSSPRRSHQQRPVQIAVLQAVLEAPETAEVAAEAEMGAVGVAAGQNGSIDTATAVDLQRWPKIETPKPKQEPPGPEPNSVTEPAIVPKTQPESQPKPALEPTREPEVIAAFNDPSQHQPKEGIVRQTDGKHREVINENGKGSNGFPQKSLEGEKQQNAGEVDKPTEASLEKPRRKPRRRNRTTVIPPVQTEERTPGAPAVTTTRSGRRVVQKCHYGDMSSRSKPVATKSLGKTNAPAEAAAEDATDATTATTATLAGNTKDSTDMKDTKITRAAKETPKAVKGERSPAAAVMRRRKLAAARWRSEFVLANTRSPLTHYDLRTLLCQPEAWSFLDHEEQREVLALFPPDTKVLDAGTADARPDVASLKNDNNFRHDCARYRSGLQDGFFNKSWLEEAFEAHAMRQEGMFDDYVLEAFESSWGVKMPDEKGEATVKGQQGREEKLSTISRKRSWDLSVKADPEALDSTGSEEVTKIDNKIEPKPPTNVPEEEVRSPKRQKQDTGEPKDGTGEAQEEVEKEAVSGVDDTSRCQGILEDDTQAGVPLLDAQQLPSSGEGAQNESVKSRELLSTEESKQKTAVKS